ncbi:MAG: hypothetical protein MK212_21805, partial [Saprospiraceae bacterium]|nr:hypothetical protein [Saprospiraceae bacterium]
NAKETYANTLSNYLLDSGTIKEQLESRLKSIFLEAGIVDGEMTFKPLRGIHDNKIVKGKVSLFYLVDTMNKNIDIMRHAVDSPSDYLSQPYGDGSLVDAFQADLDRQLKNREKTNDLKEQHDVELGNPESVQKIL